MFMNISDKYGEHVAVTVKDYRELNPEGEFYESVRCYDGDMEDVIVEYDSVPTIVAVITCMYM